MVEVSHAGTLAPIPDERLPDRRNGFITVPGMSDPGWLADARTSYDTVAVGYVDHVRDAFASEIG
jgi:hypothetical protein